jgi:hypothetical protein
MTPGKSTQPMAINAHLGDASPKAQDRKPLASKLSVRLNIAVKEKVADLVPDLYKINWQFRSDRMIGFRFYV